MSTTSSSAKSAEDGAGRSGAGSGGGQDWNHRLASLKAQPGSHHHFSNAEVCLFLGEGGWMFLLLTLYLLYDLHHHQETRSGP